MVLKTTIMVSTNWNRHLFEDTSKFTIRGPFFTLPNVDFSDGATASGIYIALSRIYDQIEQQNECDVCQTVQELRTYRKEFIQTKVSYLYGNYLFFFQNFNGF